LDRLRRHPGVRELTAGLEQQVRGGQMTATLAAERILEAFAQPDPGQP
jgi:LAO/AO transport system kinase